MCVCVRALGATIHCLCVSCLCLWCVKQCLEYQRQRGEVDPADHNSVGDVGPAHAPGNDDDQLLRPDDLQDVKQRVDGMSAAVSLLTRGVIAASCLATS